MVISEEKLSKDKSRLQADMFTRSEVGKVPLASKCKKRLEFGFKCIKFKHIYFLNRSIQIQNITHIMNRI